jgi:hypothetical protein
VVEILKQIKGLECFSKFGFSQNLSSFSEYCNDGDILDCEIRFKFTRYTSQDEKDVKTGLNCQKIVE